MRITSVKVGAHYYPVVLNSVELSVEGDWAHHDPRNRSIGIDVRERPSNAVAEDLVHEILHALFMDSGQDALDRDEEEAVCTILAPRLTAFMADNPAAVRELLVMLGCDE